MVTEKNPKKTEYRIEDIPVDLWRMVKSEAAKSGLTIREYIMQTLTQRIKKEAK